jgi:hypothetical protein
VSVRLSMELANDEYDTICRGAALAGEPTPQSFMRRTALARTHELEAEEGEG